jgi:hypothetical protein
MSPIEPAWQEFQREVRSRLQYESAEPEEQLRQPFDRFMEAVGNALGFKQVQCIAPRRLPDQLGKPDFAVYRDGLLVGYVELKAPGTGANANAFKGRNQKQFERFRALPNLLYTDGSEWALYRSGKQITLTSPNAPAELEHLLRDFLTWRPIIPFTPKGTVDMQRFAEQLGPLCRLLRDEIRESLQREDSPLRNLKDDWRKLLFPDADDDQFADGYAQTLVFALLMGRLEGADPLTPDNAMKRLKVRHELMARVLQLLTDEQVMPEIEASLNTLIRLIGELPVQPAQLGNDPWLYFYEEFLAAYDPKLRKDAGAYYTPMAVVQAQVRLVDSLLRTRLNKPNGFAESQVLTLDPAMGTGAYLLGIVDHARRQVAQRSGSGAVASAAAQLAQNLHGFERMVGPYAVAEVRLTHALASLGATLPEDGLRLYLTDTLESPHTTPPQLPLILRPIAQQHERALQVKAHAPILVCIGNPPYDRHASTSATEPARTGGWVRYGDSGVGKTLLDDFIQPARYAGHGVDLKSLYNLYVYFWRWALWKVFEQKPDSVGVVSFITAASYLRGDAFVGMRELMRRLCTEIWIIDLGGEGRGPRKSENVFNIQTPVAIAIALRDDSPKDPNAPARVRYTEITGTRQQKLRQLSEIQDFNSLQWRECPSDWHAPFLPTCASDYTQMPRLVNLMPWQHSGVQLKRTWPIAPDDDTLRQRWNNLLTLKPDDRKQAFRETRDRKVDSGVKDLLNSAQKLPPIASLASGAPTPPIWRYAYRILDRQYVLLDNRLGDYFRPDLVRAHSDKQLYLSTQLSTALGRGPALAAACHLPDIDHFPGSGGKNQIPLYRDSNANKPNITAGVLEILSDAYGETVSPEDFAAYLYGVMAHPAFTERFWDELQLCEVRVPITRDPALYRHAREIGACLLWLHTYGERYADPTANRPYGCIPEGAARCTHGIPPTPEDYPQTYHYDDQNQRLCIGDGVFEPVAPEIWAFEVSGLRVVKSWLDYRVGFGKSSKRQNSSPLDAIRPQLWTYAYTAELLNLLWILEHTLVVYPCQAALLKETLRSPLFMEADLPTPSDEMRKPLPDPAGGLFQEEGED